MSRDVVTPLYRALPDGAQGGAEVFVRTALVPLANAEFARRAPPLFVHEVLDNSVARRRSRVPRQPLRKPKVSVSVSVSVSSSGRAFTVSNFRNRARPPSTSRQRRCSSTRPAASNLTRRAADTRTSSPGRLRCLRTCTKYYRGRPARLH